MDQKEYFQHLANIGQAFTPGAPINSRDLFAGRTEQIKRVINTIFRRGQHVVLFGERGVGKTSLARTLFDILVFSGMSNYNIARVNCSDGMDFEAIWRSAFKEFVFTVDGDTATLDEQLPQQ
jgi:MoxR-like ATPase